MIDLRADGELAVTLGTEVVVHVIASTSENTITLRWDNCGSRVDVIEQSTRGISALELINRLQTHAQL